VSYSTYSDQLASDVQQLLLEFGVVSRRYRHATGEHKVVVTNRRDARLFATRVGFLGSKQTKLTEILGAGLPEITWFFQIAFAFGFVALLGQIGLLK
jgi:DNA gyrase subunit A